MLAFRGSSVRFVHWGQSLNTATAGDWPGKLNGRHHVPFSVVAPTGIQWEFLVQQAPQRFDGLAELAEEPVAILMGGSSNLLSESADTIYAREVAAAQHAATVGYTRILNVTLTPADVFSPGQELERQDLNAQKLADITNWEAVIDLTGIAALEDYDSAAYYDQLHFSDFGAELVTDEAEATLQAIGLLP